MNSLSPSNHGLEILSFRIMDVRRPDELPEEIASLETDRDSGGRLRRMRAAPVTEPQRPPPWPCAWAWRRYQP